MTVHRVSYWVGHDRVVRDFADPRAALHFARLRHPSQGAFLSVHEGRPPNSVDAWPVVALYALGLAGCLFAWWWFAA